MRQIPPFSNNDAILACTLIFCPSLIWLSIVCLLLAITVCIISNINSLIAFAKGYSHRCCYGQYLSKLFPYYLATILPAYKLRRTTAYLNIWQGYSLFSIMGMLDFEHTDCVQCLCGLPDCTDCIGDSKLPVWFICIPGLLEKYAQGKGKSLVIYQENSICFLECLCYGSGWNQYISVYFINPN